MGGYATLLLLDIGVQSVTAHYKNAGFEPKLAILLWRDVSIAPQVVNSLEQKCPADRDEKLSKKGGF